MRDALKNPMLVLLAGLTLGGCAREEEPARPETPAESPAEAPSASTAPAQPSPTPGAGPETTAGGDGRVPVASPPPGKFPYVGLIDGYEPSESNFAKDVPFDRYEFFDGTKIVPVEGRLTTIVAEGKGASAQEILRTYETLVTGMGGVKLYEGSDVRHVKATPRLAYADKRHRNGFNADRLGVYMLFIFGALSGGSALWGAVADRVGISLALLISAGCMVVGLLATLGIHLRTGEGLNLAPSRQWPAPRIQDLEPEQGPVLVSIRYRIDPDRAAEFSAAMSELRRIRLRGGAMQWGLFADSSEPGVYTELFLVSSWMEHMRQHERITIADEEVRLRVGSFHLGPEPPAVQHLIAERVRGFPTP